MMTMMMDDDDNDDDVDLDHDDDDGQIYNCRCDSFTRRRVENSPWILSHQTGYPFIQWWRWWWCWWWIEIIELLSLVKTTCRAPSASISWGMLNKLLHFAETLNWEGCERMHHCQLAHHVSKTDKVDAHWTLLFLLLNKILEILNSWTYT